MSPIQQPRTRRGQEQDAGSERRAREDRERLEQAQHDLAELGERDREQARRDEEWLEQEQEEERRRRWWRRRAQRAWPAASAGLAKASSRRTGNSGTTRATRTTGNTGSSTAAVASDRLSSADSSPDETRQRPAASQDAAYGGRSNRHNSQGDRRRVR